MRQIVSAACGLFLCLSLPGLAQTSPDVATNGVVVELYTSQGCSSCPPADEFLAELAGAEHVIALSLHVDYWDYIGWEDKFAHAAFTERQKSYAREAKSRMIYTPQMIVGGVDRVEGNAPDAVVKLIGRHMAVARAVTLTVERQGDVLVIRAVANPPLTEGAEVQVVRYLPEATVAIERGENAGRTVTYRNIVTGWDKIGDWPGIAPLEMQADVPAGEPVVVIVQEPGPAAILAAAQLK